jgi:hypothetical protein
MSVTKDTTVFCFAAWYIYTDVSKESSASVLRVHDYVASHLTYLLTYLVHGAESFLSFQ